MWKCHVDESTISRYDTILGRDLLTALGLYLKFLEKFIIGGDRPYEGWLATMVDVSNCDFTYLTDKTVKSEESFINSYFNECLESDITISSMRRICGILDAKYKKEDLNKVTAKQCQHLTSNKYRNLLDLLKSFE